MLDITEQYKRIGLAYVNGFLEAFQPGCTPAPEMHTVNCEICFDAKMKVRNNEMTHLTNDNQCRAVTKKFKIHSALTNPFWG
jgi:hypothetical protein